MSSPPLAFAKSEFSFSALFLFNTASRQMSRSRSVSRCRKGKVGWHSRNFICRRVGVSPVPESWLKRRRPPGYNGNVDEDDNDGDSRPLRRRHVPYYYANVCRALGDENNKVAPSLSSSGLNFSSLICPLTLPP